MVALNGYLSKTLCKDMFAAQHFRFGGGQGAWQRHNFHGEGGNGQHVRRIHFKHPERLVGVSTKGCYAATNDTRRPGHGYPARKDEHLCCVVDREVYPQR